MKRILYLVALVSVFALASCSNMKFDPKEQVKNSEFAKLVGGVDAAQTWNLASVQSVDVTADGPVRVYVSDGKRNVLVAEQVIKGTKTIKFDAPANAKKVLVMNMNGGEIRSASIGSAVSFVSKTTYNGDDGNVSVALGDYSEFTYRTVKSDVALDAFTDIDASAALFYSASGTFTLYPAWYNQISAWGPTFGIYYYDGDGNKVDVPVFWNNGQVDDMIQIRVDWSENGFQTISDDDMAILDTYREEDFVGIFRSKGITVTVPANTAFGFYIKRGNASTNTLYSESQYNYIVSWEKNAYTGPCIGDSVADFGRFAVIENEGRKYLGVDDWCEIGPDHSLTNPEYWHLVFSVEGDLADHLGGEDPIGEDGAWILACEDLGDHADYDFNDVVLSVTHMANSTEAEVKLLAAGGTIPTYIYYGEQNLGEVHALFGVETKVMVNTFPGTEKKAPVTIPITVPADFTMSATDMGGFTIKSGNSTSVIAAPDMGTVPYMICIPGNWKWPKEMVSIETAYPLFSTWCNDHTQALDWYLTYVEDKVYNN